MDQTNQSPATDKTRDVLVNVVLDRSGSMQSCRANTISGYNEYINGLRADKETNYNITLIQFDSPHDGPELTVSYSDKTLSDIKDLSESGYEPRGMTPLYDAVGECIRRVDAKGRGIITVIISDGMDNASREFTKDSIKNLIAEKEKEGWTFCFLGANIDSYTVGTSLGVTTSNISNYSQGDEKNLYSNLAKETNLRASAYRTVGMKAATSMAFVSSGMRASLEKDVKLPKSNPTPKET